MKSKFAQRNLFILLIALALPIFSLSHYCLIINHNKQMALIILGLISAISLFSFFSCKRDKQKAINGEWRTPEVNLHLLEFIGGWPGSYIAQRIYRHKVSKRKYQTLFWFIVFIHNFISVDYLNSWDISKVIVEAGKNLAS
jgi:uncharacterized membrane protein YsdA (DUF1294 family)